MYGPIPQVKRCDETREALSLKGNEELPTLVAEWFTGNQTKFCCKKLF
jgi:hypothetical protein